MYLREATHELLMELDRPVITEYELFILTTKLLKHGSFRGRPIRRVQGVWDTHSCRRLIRNLMRERVLVPDDDFAAGAWRLVQSSTAGSTEDVCCLVDPFCYVSHLSAMHFHGLLEGPVQEVHFTTPARNEWRTFRDEKMRLDLRGISASLAVPALVRIGFRSRVRKRNVLVRETTRPAPTVDLNSGGRVERVGYVFVETLNNPQLCGGMRQVIDVWKRHATRHLDEIIDAVDQQATKIIRVRAGYILEDLLGLIDWRIQRWTGDAQRGGSRKLDPDGPYAPVFSERWMLSLNI